MLDVYASLNSKQKLFLKENVLSENLQKNAHFIRLYQKTNFIQFKNKQSSISQNFILGIFSDDRLLPSNKVDTEKCPDMLTEQQLKLHQKDVLMHRIST